MEWVEAGIHSRLKKQIAVYDIPSSPEEAKFSMPFHVAAGIVYPDMVGLAPYTEERVLDSKVQELIKKIKIYVHPELTEDIGDLVNTQFLKIRLKDGREFSIKADKAGGYPEQPLSREELLGKYRDCAQRVFSPLEVEHSIELMDSLEELEDISMLTKVLEAKA